MRRKRRDEALRWLMQAEHDLDDAKFNADGKRYNVACFLCQQAAEKALKAYLISVGDDPWGHSVAELAEMCAESLPGLAEAKRDIAGLDKHYIPTRYPNGLPGGIPSQVFSADDAERALALAERAIAIVRKALENYLK